MSVYYNASRHWSGVGQRFLTDASIVACGFYAACVIRFYDWAPPKLVLYLPTILICALLLPATIYICGLYAEEGMHYTRVRHHARLGLALGVMILAALAIGSLAYSARMGRGVGLLGVAVSGPCVWLHHAMLRRNAAKYPLRLMCLVAGATDANEALRLAAINKPQVKLVGVLTVGGGDWKDCNGLQKITTLEELDGDSARAMCDALVCSPDHISDPALTSRLRSLRYRGVNVMTFMDAFEDLYQIAPLELVNENWLIQASSKPQILYIRNLKRAFDIVVALGLILLLGPLCLLAMVVLRLSTSDTVLFRQVRCGRFGRTFTLFKLRTMLTNAEANGPQWSKAGDKRVTPLGRWLRRYRIDEIPQLVNILQGDMSFVGPRPEQPAFVSELEKQIGHFRERLLMQPGLTGWAQVRYPYGASVEDARRKLEYDLYYLKHMSLSLDLFVLLDTVRTILGGGAAYTPPVPVRQPMTASASDTETSAA